MSSIIEYIGKNKLIHANNNLLHFRYQQPKAGDVIDFGENYKENTYPYNQNRYGTFIGEDGFCKVGEVSICCESGSIFLGLGKDDRVFVDISGGPFSTVAKKDLIPLYVAKIQYMWNWGNNSAGASQGVYYSIERPVFLWDGNNEEA